MRKLSTKAKLIALAAASTLVLSACSGGGSTNTADTATDKQSGATAITAAVGYKTDNYHPSTTSSALALGSNWHVVEGLYELEKGTFKPFRALAADDEPTKVSDTEYTVKLRDGAKFSDGTAVTAADVVASFKRTNAEGNLYVSMLSFIEDVTEVDTNTVSIKLKYPFSLLKERLSLIKIVPAAASDEDLTSMPVGSGPWKYDSITETGLKFSPNEHYNGTMPATAKTMEWQILMDDTARVTALQEGTVQVAENIPADAVETAERNGATVTSVQGFGLPFLMFNTSKAPFDKKEVRQAFHYAINTEQLIENALSGKAEPATSFLPENHPNYNKAATVYDHNPEKAKQLLAEAGVSDLSVTLLTTDHGWITAMAPQIQNDLQAVGINVTIQSEASSSLYANYADAEAASYDLALAPGDPSVFGNDPALLMNWWYGNNVWTQKRSYWGTSPEFAQLQTILEASVKAEGEEQQKLWNQAFDLVATEVPLYPLLHRQVSTGFYADQLDGYTPIGTTGLNFVGVSLK